MGRIFSKAEKVETPLPKPEPPVAMPEVGEGDITQQRHFLKAGRGGTIMAGQLSPRNIFKRRLLG